VVFTVPDVEAAVSYLTDQGIRFTRSPVSGAVQIDPADAAGARNV